MKKINKMNKVNKMDKMRRLFVSVLALMMVMSMTTAAFAATEPAAVVISSDEASEAPYEAKTVSVSDGYQMDVPAAFSVVKKDGVTVMSDESHTVMVTTKDAAVSEYASIASAKKAYINAGLQKSMVDMTINGMPALGVLTEDGVYTVMIETSDDQITTIRFLNFDTTDQTDKVWIENMLMSFTAKENTGNGFAAWIENLLKSISGIEFGSLASGVLNFVQSLGRTILMLFQNLFA